MRMYSIGTRVETGECPRLTGHTGAFGRRAWGLPTDYWFVGGASQTESEKGAAYCAGVGHIFVQAFGYALVELEQSLHCALPGAMKGMFMATTTWFARAPRLLAVVLAGALAAGCANNENQPSSQLTGRDGSVAPGTHRDFSVNVGDIVYFTTDSTDLTPEATATLQKQAQWLQHYPQYTITIEGHADERGTREYNIALGARRATTVRNFLAQNGINGARIRTISYGKERPVAVCNDISCWSQNRRAQTVLNSRTAGN